MKTLGLLVSLWAASAGLLLGADGATNAERLVELQALSFGEVKKISVVQLSAPAKKGEAEFHGCARRSRWREIPVVANESLIALLRELIADGVTAYSVAGDGPIVWLQPFGFVYGELGIRLETDRGRREFAITPGMQTSYVYAYDGKKHSECFVVEGPAQERLRQSLPSQATRAGRTE